MNKMKKWITCEFEDYRILLRNVPCSVMVLFVVSIVMMNLLANKDVNFGVDWLAIDCGFSLSWASFLSMDMLTKRFGARASIKLSLFAVGINLMICGILYLVSLVPGNWGAYYDYGNAVVNTALNSTIGGTWYVLMGSTIAFVISSVINSSMNAGLGKLMKKDTFKTYAVRSYVSTLVGQFIDNLIFATIVSYPFFGWSFVQCVTCSVTGCLIELVCEIIFSPMGYKICKKWESLDIGEQYLKYVVERNIIK